VQSFIVGDQVKQGSIVDSIVSPGCTIVGGHVEHSILSSNVVVKAGAEIRNSIIMESVVIEQGAQIQNAIIDKQNVVPAGEKIGFNLDIERERFNVTASGITIVPKRTLT